MAEAPEVRAALERARAEGRRAALATVVHVAGSAYRREGARMVVLDDGSRYGMISGGCLEDAVADAARQVLQTGRPQLLRYDMTADDDVVWGLGLGCNGVIDVYVEPVEAGAAGAESEAGGGAVPGAAGHRERRAVVTVVRGRQGGPETGARMVVYADRVEGTLGDPDLDAAAAADARRMMEEGASQSLLYTYRGGRLDPEAVVRRRRDVLEAGPEHVQVAIQSIVPPPVLLIFGAGHDAIPLARYGHEAGFRVIVVDSRRAYATPERFPEADRVIHAHPDEALDHVTIDRYTYVVVMTHNFNHDRDILRAIWGQPYAYLGVLGPWDRTRQLLQALRSGEGVRDLGGDAAAGGAGGVDVDAHLDRLYGPIGLDIGAEGPEQIAIAVIAEILAVRNRRSGGFLRFRQGSIHEVPA